MRTAIALSMVLALTAPVLADESDDTLRFYLSKSDFVVLGEITTVPFRIVEEVGVTNYYCEFRVAEILKGRKLGTDTINVDIVRFELDKQDQLSELKKNGKCILFLKNAGSGEKPTWQTADFWFGFQHPSPWMTRSVRRLVEHVDSKTKLQR
jgi:hypothetical protein